MREVHGTPHNPRVREIFVRYRTTAGWAYFRGVITGVQRMCASARMRGHPARREVISYMATVRFDDGETAQVPITDSNRESLWLRATEEA